MQHDQMGVALVGATDIAVMLGVSRQRVGQLINTYSDFPAPVDVVGHQRVWKRRDIERWIALHRKRQPGRPRKTAK